MARSHNPQQQISKQWSHVRESAYCLGQGGLSQSEMICRKKATFNGPNGI
jgi:hypothetical protein